MDAELESEIPRLQVPGCGLEPQKCSWHLSKCRYLVPTPDDRVRSSGGGSPEVYLLIRFPCDVTYTDIGVPQSEQVQDIKKLPDQSDSIVLLKVVNCGSGNRV